MYSRLKNNYTVYSCQYIITTRYVGYTNEILKNIVKKVLKFVDIHENNSTHFCY